MNPAARRPEPRWWKGLAGLFIAVLVTLTVAGPAMGTTGATSDAVLASATTGLSTSASTGVSQAVNGPLSTRILDDTPNANSTARGVCTADIDAEGQLPVTRWDEGTEFHDRLHSSRPGDIAKNIQRQGLVSFMFGVGNTAWAATTGMTEMAINFCVLDRVGGTVDHTAADLGGALVNSGVVAILVVASVVVFLWRVGRSQGGGANTAGLLQKGVVLGMIAVMIAGASDSTGGGAGANPGDPYKPGFGAPGWFITTIDQVVSTSASLLAGSVETKTIDGAEKGPAGRANLGCAPYVRAMKKIYREKHGVEYGSEAAATVPLLLSSMWENSGLEMWKRAQFGNQTIGTTDDNRSYGYGDLMYCRMLELNVASKRHPTTTYYDDSVSSIMTKTGALSKETFGIKIADSGDMEGIPGYPGTEPVWHTDGENLAWRYSTSNKKRDRTYVGWAACASPQVDGEGNDPGAALIHDDEASDTQLRDNCRDFFTNAGWEGGGGSGEFDWDEADDDISDTNTTDEAQDFLLTLHGSRQASGLVAGLVYMFSSLLVAGVFILLSCAIMVAKVSALMMMLGIILVLVLSLAPNASMRKIADYGKQYLGLSVFAWAATLIMSVLALITAILIEAGNAVVPGGPGDVVAIAWVGFAPVIAVFCLHFIFKKLRIPSPLKMSGGMAWGQMAASGAVGGAVGMGAGALVARAGNRVKSRAAQGAKQVTSKVTGKERKGRMTPGGAKPETTGGQRKGGLNGPEASSSPVEQASSKPTVTGAASAADPNKPAAGTRPEDMTKAEKKSVLGTAKAEKKDAKEFAKTVEGKAEIKKIAGSRTQRAARAASGALGSAGKQFANKPLATTKKAAMVGTGAVVLGAATGGLGLVAGAGVYAAQKKVRQHVAQRPETKAAMLRGESTSTAVEALRTQRTRQQNARVEAEQASMRRAYEGNAQSMQRDVAEQKFSEDRRGQMAERLGGVDPGAKASGHTVEVSKGRAAAAASAGGDTQAQAGPKVRVKEVGPRPQKAPSVADPTHEPTPAAAHQ